MRNETGELGFAVYVGGGLGRTPFIGQKVRDFLPERDLLALLSRRSCASTISRAGATTNTRRASRSCCTRRALEALARGGRGGIRGARPERARRCRRRRSRASRAYFAPPALEPKRADERRGSSARRGKDAQFAELLRANVTPHKAPGYAIVTVSLKPIGGVPGDASADQMDAVADLAEDYSQRRDCASRTSRTSILPHVALDDLPAVYDRLASVGLATPNAGLISDIIACPGLDYCALATARSIPDRRSASAERFGDGARAQGDRPAEDQDLRLHQRLRPSSRRPHRHSRPRARGRRDLSDHARRLGRRDRVDRPDHRPRLQLRERGRRGRDDRRRPIWAPRRRRDETFLDAYPPGRHGAVQGGALRTQRRIGHLMSAHDVKLFGDADRRLAARDPLRAASRRRRCSGSRSRTCSPAASRWSRASAPTPRRCCTWSSQVDKATPVVFVDTGQHFPGDARLSRRARRAPRPDQRRQRRARGRDARRRRTRRSSCSRAIPDRCCEIRKVLPLAARDGGLRRLDHRPQGLPEHDARDAAAVRGRGRAGQGQSARRLERERHPRLHPARPDCRRHPLVAKGFPSIGCLPCTSAVKPGEDARAGRWRGTRQDRMRHPHHGARRGSEHLMALWRDGGFAEDDLDASRRRRAGAAGGRGDRVARALAGASARRSPSARRRSASRSRPARTRRRISPTSPTGRWSRSRSTNSRDGRAFSYAILLRDRYGFTGELRAIGDVLIDEIPLMLRCGFTAFEVTNAPTHPRARGGTAARTDDPLPAGERFRRAPRRRKAVAQGRPLVSIRAHTSGRSEAEPRALRPSVGRLRGAGAATGCPQ